MTRQQRRVLLLVGAGLILCTGCAGVYERYGYGLAAGYRNPDAGDSVAVVLPANAPTISQQFNPTFRPEDLVKAPHMGIDIMVLVGTPVLAPAAGTVREVSRSLAYGRTLILDHGRDDEGRQRSTRYLHLQQVLVKQGEQVIRGQQLGLSGRSGFLAGFPHLHFEVWEQQPDGRGRPHNPHYYWIDGPGRVTCFDAARLWPAATEGLTYPVPCRGVAWRQVVPQGTARAD